MYSFFIDAEPSTRNIILVTHGKLNINRDFPTWNLLFRCTGSKSPGGDSSYMNIQQLLHLGDYLWFENWRDIRECRLSLGTCVDGA